VFSFSLDHDTIIGIIGTMSRARRKYFKSAKPLFMGICGVFEKKSKNNFAKNHKKTGKNRPSPPRVAGGSGRRRDEGVYCRRV
jgi:hypothetical protein